MPREIFAYNSGKEESRTGGWFQCSNCKYSVMLRGKIYYIADDLRKYNQPIICSTCDPKHGLEPEIRTNQQILGILGYAGDGIG